MSNALIKQLSGAGMDQVEETQSMPFIKLLAFQSPEVIDPDKQIEGAKAGDLIFTPTKEILSQPVEFAVMAKKTIYAEWVPLAKGGGLVAHHGIEVIDHPNYKQGSATSKWDEFLGENELKLTMYYIIKFKKDEEWVDAILAFSKSALSAAGRPLNNMIKNFRYPPEAECFPFLFSQTYLLSSFLAKNDENQWYNWKVEEGTAFDLEDADDQKLLNTFLDASKAAQGQLPAPTEQKKLAPAGVIEADEVF